MPLTSSDAVNNNVYTCMTVPVALTDSSEAATARFSDPEMLHVLVAIELRSTSVYLYSHTIPVELFQDERITSDRSGHRTESRFPLVQDFLPLAVVPVLVQFNLVVVLCSLLSLSQPVRL